MQGLIDDLGNKRQVIEKYGLLLSNLKTSEKEKKTGVEKKIAKGTREWPAKNVNC